LTKSHVKTWKRSLYKIVIESNSL